MFCSKKETKLARPNQDYDPSVYWYTSATVGFSY